MAIRGFGIGLRAGHYAELLERGVPVRFAEAISENHLGRGGRPRAVLERVRRDTDIALHGVSLSIGATDPLNESYLCELRALRHEIDAAWISDHLCFGTSGGHYAHDLWPLPYTEEALQHVVERVLTVQDRLAEPILLENVSSYVSYASSTLTEWEMLSEVCRRCDAGLLLDVNNVVVNAYNHGFSAYTYIDGLPLSRVRQLHLAGHADKGAFRLDDHGSAVCDETWALYRYVLQRTGEVPVIIEWDSQLPALEVVLEQARRAERIAREVLDGH